MWRSLVARLVRDEEVVGSNPAIPTTTGRRLRSSEAPAGYSCEACPVSQRSERATVRALVVALFVQGVGASAVLPMLPLFLRQRHTSSAMIGAVIAAYFLAGVLTQYAAGHVTDRIGHRRVIVTGLAIYAIASAGYLLSIGAAGYAVLRALQGLGAGALMVAGLSLVAVVVPAGQRGRAFSLVFASQLGGMAVGPLIGSAAGVAHIKALFVFTSIAAVVATLPVLLGTPLTRAAGPRHELPRLAISRGLVGVVLVGVSGGVIAGSYEACWSLLMTSRGAKVWQIGLSWTLFAVPFAAISPWAGRLVDRFDRRHLAIAAMVANAGFAVTYPFLPAPGYLIALGSLESVGVAISFPAAQSLLSDTASAAALGRAQGLFTTAETAAIAIAAAVSGWLFSQARWLPFVVVAAVAAGLTLALPALWRDVPGHAHHRRDSPDGPGLSPSRQAAGAVADVTVKA
jgi:DHA1 family multidrug resistance protein-like MFS transporter